MISENFTKYETDDRIFFVPVNASTAFRKALDERRGGAAATYASVIINKMSGEVIKNRYGVSYE